MPRGHGPLSSDWLSCWSTTGTSSTASTGGIFWDLYASSSCSCRYLTSSDSCTPHSYFGGKEERKAALVAFFFVASLLVISLPWLPSAVLFPASSFLVNYACYSRWPPGTAPLLDDPRRRRRLSGTRRRKRTVTARAAATARPILPMLPVHVRTIPIFS